MDLNPINEWIIVEEEELITKTLSGLYVPKMAQEKQVLRRCKVIAISPDIEGILKEDNQTLRFKVGDTVIHNSQTGIKVDMNDKNDRKYFMKYTAVMAICDNATEDFRNVSVLRPLEENLTDSLNLKGKKDE